MKRFFLVMLVAASLAPSRALAQTTRPNIVFILIDDQRWDCLSCVGHPFLKTPNIDRIAKEGVIFDNAFITTPLCSPSRSSFLTGQYVHKTRVYGNGDSSAISHQLITWPALLQQGGYETAWIGKLHMGSDASPRPGFDRWICLPGQGIYVDPVLNIDGDQHKVPGYVTDLLNDYAVDFIRKDHGGKPFAVCLAHKAVHQPARPATRHADLYETEKLPRRPNVDDEGDGKPILERRSVRSTTQGQRAGAPGKLQRDMLRCIQSVDDGVGKIFKALEETHQLDNTLIIYTSDNGYLFGEHHLGDKRGAYEESIRVPLLMRYPKLIPAASRLSEIALNIDIAPTALQLAGAPIPSTTDGKSLIPLFENKLGEWRGGALFEYFHEPRYPLFPTWQALRTPQWKYIHYLGVEDSDELYDLKSDPYELKNLIGDNAAQDTLKDLKSQLQKALDETK